MFIAELVFDFIRAIIKCFKDILHPVVLVFEGLIMQVVPAQYPGIISLFSIMFVYCSNGIAPLKTLWQVTQYEPLFFCFIGVKVQVVVVIGAQADD